MSNRYRASKRLGLRLVPLAALLGLLLTANQPASAQDFSVLYSFKGLPDGDGANPYSGNLVWDEQGNLYGTTVNGGAGFGTVFKIAPNGTEPLHYAFSGEASDGAYPYGGLVEDSRGNMYGTTTGGGIGPCSGGCGTVFRVTSSGTEAVLYSFVGSPTDGADPESGLVLDSEGDLYGTTVAGGIQNSFEDLLQGTVFELTPSGAESVLASFDCYPRGLYGYCPDGIFPEATVLPYSEGNLFGTAEFDGSGRCSESRTGACGTVFEVGVSAGVHVVHSFEGPPDDGANPQAGLVRDVNGGILGTTYAGGAQKLGTVFEINAAGKETVLYSFKGSPDDGSNPSAGISFDNRGDFYGTTSTGGTYGYGTVFEINAAGDETVLYSFSGGVDGGTPLAGLVLDKEGNLYGTTEYGGSSNCDGGCGVVFKLTP